MPTFLSPAVFTNEIDLSALPNSASGIVPAFIGTASKGQLNKATLVTNAQNFIDNFGEPFAESFLGYAVLAFLEEGNLCWVLRVGVEAEEGQPEELAEIAIDTSGAKTSGWGRIPVFKGIDFGKITTRDGSTGFTFQAAGLNGSPSFNDAVVSTTEGPTDATLNVTASGYTGSIADSFLVLITGSPVATSGSNVDGATFQVIRTSDGAVVQSGALTESPTPGLSDPVTLPDSLSFTVQMVSGVLDANDSFTFSVFPDNRNFSVAVDNDVTGASDFVMPSATYADATALVAAINTLIGSSEPYLAVDNGDETASLRTRTAGEMIQLITTEGFALEIGQSLYAFDIPRSHVLATSTGAHDVTSQNNSVTIQVQGVATKQFTAAIPVGANMATTTVAQAITAAATVLGDTLCRSYALTIPGGEQVLVVETVVAHELDQVSMLADGSHIKTLRFTEAFDILYPYTTNYRGFVSTSLTLPAGGEITENTPLSCEVSPFGSQCAVDTAYYENIVGFLVATSAGTWIDDYTVNLQLYNSTPGAYSVIIIDNNGITQSRIDNVTFNPSDLRYIGNVVNPGSPIGGLNGNEFVNWIRRPIFLNDDPSDVANFQVRLPAPFFNKAFGGQANGIPADPLYSSELDRAVIGNPALETGIYTFANPERFEMVSLLCTPGFSSGAVIVTALSVCTQRGDCLYIVDPPFGLNTQQVVDWHNGLLFTDLAVALDSSYGALYHPWVKIFDQFNGGDIFIPPSGHICAVFARTDRVAEIWFAPAGFNRGQIITGLDLEVEHTRGQRDLMYGFGNAVNPIVKFPQKGIYVFGQRTLQRKDSALDRVNVRMLLIAIKKALAGSNGSLQYFLFEQNDRITRQLVKSQIDSYMSDVLARRGVTAFSTVCDDTNNTPARIDRNELWVSLLVKPTRAIEFIVLNIGILRTDQSFVSQEVLAAVGVTTSI